MSQAYDGPSEPMIVLTKIMKPGPARVGRIAGNLSLPRSVELPTAFATGGGALTGLVLLTLFGGGISGMTYGALFGGLLGWVAMNYSPLEGETLMRWVGLNVKARQHQILWRGEPVQVSVGLCPIEPLREERMQIMPGAVNVPSSQYDRRGVRITAGNMNLDEAASSTVWAGGDLGGGFVGAGRPADPSSWLDAAIAEPAGRRKPLRLPDLSEADADIDPGTPTASTGHGGTVPGAGQASATTPPRGEGEPHP